MEKYEKDTNEYCNKQNDKAIIETIIIISIDLIIY